MRQHECLYSLLTPTAQIDIWCWWTVEVVGVIDCIIRVELMPSQITPPRKANPHHPKIIHIQGKHYVTDLQNLLTGKLPIGKVQHKTV